MCHTKTGKAQIGLRDQLAMVYHYRTTVTGEMRGDNTNGTEYNAYITLFDAISSPITHKGLREV